MTICISPLSINVLLSLCPVSSTYPSIFDVFSLSQYLLRLLLYVLSILLYFNLRLSTLFIYALFAFLTIDEDITIYSLSSIAISSVYLFTSFFYHYMSSLCNVSLYVISLSSFPSRSSSTTFLSLSPSFLFLYILSCFCTHIFSVHLHFPSNVVLVLSRYVLPLYISASLSLCPLTSLYCYILSESLFIVDHFTVGWGAGCVPE